MRKPIQRQAMPDMKVELVHADARDLPFDPGTFDIVTSCLVP